MLTIATTEGEAIGSFAFRVADAWELGQARDDNGLLLVVAREDRRWRIEVGHGLEGAIPDIRANRIAERELVPRFRNDDYAGGIEAAVVALEAAARGEPFRHEPVPSMLFTSVIASLFALPFHRRGRRALGALLGGLFSAGLTWWMTAAFAPWALLALVLGGILAWFGAGHATPRVGGGPWIPGGGYGGGRGGGLGGGLGGGFGGGFGGGGSFGGGGASGSW